MLVAIAKPHQQFPVPLTAADYEFSTSDDGDERGRVTLPPTFARSGVMTQIGDELIVYCTQLSRTVWRGQIERIEEARDGSITWHALGFGALQRDARISVVRNMTDMNRWKPVGAGIMAGSGYDSRGDLWEYELVSYGGYMLVHIRTKKAFTISNTTLFFLTYLFDRPLHYYKIENIERIFVYEVSSGLASGVWVAPVVTVISTTTYQLSLGTFNNINTSGSVITGNCFGWVIGVRASGNETTAGVTSVWVRAEINNLTSGAIDESLLSTALIERGGCCTIHLPPNTKASITKPDANLRDIIENSDGTVRYHRKRFLRDRPRPTVDFRTDSPLVWRFPETTRVVDISKAPNRVYGQYPGYWAEYLTAPKTILSLETRRQLANRFASVGAYDTVTIAEDRRDEAAVALDRQIAPLAVELDNARYELMLRTGETVPNWAADVSDYAIVPNYYRNAKITARVITRDRTTYTVSFNPDDFVTALR